MEWLDTIEKNAVSKDGKKGEKDAIKKIKKLEEVNQFTLNTLIESVYKQTTNGDYIEGFTDIIRQVIASITIAA